MARPGPHPAGEPGTAGAATFPTGGDQPMGAAVAEGRVDLATIFLGGSDGHGAG
jgi:hypothetical protein